MEDSSSTKSTRCLRAAPPTGTVDDAGTVRLSTFAQDDGAPAGEYKVTVEQWTTLRPDEGPANRLPAKYAKPETSGLTATVSDRPTDLPTLELKR